MKPLTDYTEAELREMPAGVEMNALVLYSVSSEDEIVWRQPSTSIADAWREAQG